MIKVTIEKSDVRWFSEWNHTSSLKKANNQYLVRLLPQNSTIPLNCYTWHFSNWLIFQRRDNLFQKYNNVEFVWSCKNTKRCMLLLWESDEIHADCFTFSALPRATDWVRRGTKRLSLFLAKWGSKKKRTGWMSWKFSPLLKISVSLYKKTLGAQLPVYYT